MSSNKHIAYKSVVTNANITINRELDDVDLNIESLFTLEILEALIFKQVHKVITWLKQVSDAVETLIA